MGSRLIPLPKCRFSPHNLPLLILLAVLATHTSVYAEPLFNPHDKFTLNKDWKSPGPKVKAPENVTVAMEMDFQSFDPNDKSGEPLMENHTNQVMKMRKLPRDPKDTQAIKDGVPEKLELTFDQLVTSSSVVVPGMKKPFKTRNDLGTFLAGKPLVIRGDGKTAKRIDGLQALRDQAAQEVKDPVSRSTILQVLSENILLKTGTAVSQNSSCLEQLEKKKVGDKWGFSREEQGAKIEYGCEFEGWAEAKGKKVAVLKIESGKQRQTRLQPNGVPGVTETEGNGTVYFEPETQESLLRMETRIYAEPTQAEIDRLKAKGATVPRNRSVMKLWNHLYPL